MVYELGRFTEIEIENNMILSIQDGDFRQGGEIFNSYDNKTRKHLVLKEFLNKYKDRIEKEVEDIFNSEIEKYKAYYKKDKDIVDIRCKIEPFLISVIKYNKSVIGREKMADYAKAELMKFTKQNLR